MAHSKVKVENKLPQKWGALAAFEGPTELYHAAEKVREAGYKNWDCYSPFPIHGMDKAMGEQRSKIGFIAGMTALMGGLGAITLQGWTSTFAYPLVISGKPFFSYQAYFPITFALSVLFAAFGAFFGFFFITKVLFNHPIFNSEQFHRFSDDGFFICIEAKDPKFNEDTVKALFEKCGAKSFEIVEGEE